MYVCMYVCKTKPRVFSTHYKSYQVFFFFILILVRCDAFLNLDLDDRSHVYNYEDAIASY